jgi:hypothetical protein
VAIIYSYPIKITPNGGDTMIISDLEDRKLTKQITLNSLKTLIDTTYTLNSKTNATNKENIDIDLTDSNGVVSSVEVAAGNNVTLQNNTSNPGKYTINAQGDKTYVFTQNDSTVLTWNIPHNLNKYPSVSVVDSALTTLYGEITYVDVNNLTITFSAGFTGNAFCN